VALYTNVTTESPGLADPGAILKPAHIELMEDVCQMNLTVTREIGMREAISGFAASSWLPSADMTHPKPPPHHAKAEKIRKHRLPGLYPRAGGAR
jgi:hypothetical protein